MFSSNSITEPSGLIFRADISTIDLKNDEKDMTGVDGTMTYLTELGVNLENASSLIPLEIVQAPSLGEMSREKFVQGWKAAA